MVCWQADPLPQLKSKSEASDSGQRNLQFHSALGDLLELRGHSLHKFKTAAAEALEALRAFDLVASELHSAVEASDEDEIFVEMSERDSRARLIRSLHQLLAECGLDAGVGAKSLITLLIMELEDNPRWGGDEEGKYRKGLARQIKIAVNDEKVNELAKQTR